ncbi:Autoantigen NGP-1 [Giardia duodenalis]|uniref:Autoantigen NGP-1 n=1 Tax=Giardia intestinalis TaxID=5741 RepID=V6TZC2_GIAIN|nr:Autoantigen NGP-1 [Giardia intestinalis]
MVTCGKPKWRAEICMQTVALLRLSSARGPRWPSRATPGET